MKRNNALTVFVVIILIAILCVGFYGYFKSPAGKYYVYNAGNKTSTWIDLTFFGKWKDGSGATGKYEREGKNVTLLNEKGETVATGTFERGVIRLSGGTFGTAVYCRKNHTHTFDSKVACKDRICTACGETVKATDHKLNRNCVCTYCGETHHNFNGCVCSNCGKTNHNYVNCVCTKCGDTQHTYVNCVCIVCGNTSHNYGGLPACVNRTCANCRHFEPASEEHTYNSDCICTKCGHEEHVIVGCVCKRCGQTWHNYVNCVCTECGKTNHTYNSKCVCVYCGDEKHNFGTDHLCSVCGKVDPSYVKSAFNSAGYLRLDSAIYFGMYPQTRITSKAIVSALNVEAPTAADANGWTKYNYYKEGAASDYMWYIDKEYNGEKYRGIYFISYRPTSCESVGSTAYSNQDENGYTTYTVYWFRYEPIKWVVLAESDGYATILADLAIDSQAYYHDGLSYPDNPDETEDAEPYANNYAESDIREWLNDDFYNTAFTDLQKGLIQTVTVDNSAASTYKSSEKYACENTEDKVWLLSYQEIFRKYFYNPGQRTKGSTDYAKAQGCYRDTSNNGNCKWWLRSPYYAESTYAQYADGNGEIYNIYVSGTEFGVVPAVKVKLG